MQESLIRLECLKLAHRHDRTPSDVIGVASAYEKYVAGVKVDQDSLPAAPAQKQDASPSAEQENRKGKKSGNISVLS